MLQQRPEEEMHSTLGLPPHLLQNVMRGPSSGGYDFLASALRDSSMHPSRAALGADLRQPNGQAASDEHGQEHWQDSAPFERVRRQQLRCAPYLDVYVTGRPDLPHFQEC